MFGKKSRKKSRPEAAPEQAETKKVETGRLRSEGLGNVWLALTGMDPARLLPQVVGTVLSEGGTRPAWQWERKGEEYKLLAWPREEPARASVLFAGPVGGELKPVTAVPLLEGLPNDLEVAEVHPRAEGLGGDVAVNMMDDKNPMWFFDPLFDRDRDDLTPGVTHTFWLSALAFGVRPALLDHITLTRGPQYEAYAANWLAEHPGATSADAPPLKIDIAGKHFIMPGRFFGEYQARATIERIQECKLDKTPIKILYLNFPFEHRPDLRLPLYVSEFAQKDVKLEEGKEIDAYMWLEGRIIDLEAPGHASDQAPEEEKREETRGD